MNQLFIATYLLICCHTQGMQESKAGEGGEGGGQPQQQRGKGKRRVVDAGLAALPEEEEGGTKTAVVYYISNYSLQPQAQ